jgi:hypothetical protein
VYLYARLASGLLTHLGGERIIFFTKSQHRFIPAMFPSISMTVEVRPPYAIDRIGAQPLTPEGGHMGVYYRPSWYSLTMMGCRGVTFIDCLRGNLRLPWNSRLEQPRKPTLEEIAEARLLLQQNGVEQGCLALICPDSTTTFGLQSIPDRFWAMLVTNLQERGIQVVTNMGPSTKLLEGTVGLKIPLRLFRAVALLSRCLLARRSGLCDLISDLPIKLAVFYPSANWYGGKCIDVSGLGVMGLKHDAVELEVGPEEHVKAISEFDALTQGW